MINEGVVILHRFRFKNTKIIHDSKNSGGSLHYKNSNNNSNTGNKLENKNSKKNPFEQPMINKDNKKNKK